MKKVEINNVFSLRSVLLQDFEEQFESNWWSVKPSSPSYQKPETDIFTQLTGTIDVLENQEVEWSQFVPWFFAGLEFVWQQLYRRGTTGTAYFRKYFWNKEFEDIFCFMERARGSVLLHSTIPSWEQTPKTAGAFSSLWYWVVCVTLSRKVLSKLIHWCDSISYGAESSRMQEDNNGICSLLQLALQNTPLWAIAGMLSVPYKSRLWIVSTLVAVSVVERTSVNTRIVQTLIFQRVLHRNSQVPQEKLEREELQLTVVTIKFLQISASRKDKKYLMLLQGELSLPEKEQGREEGSHLSPYPLRNLFEERGTSNNNQQLPSCTDSTQLLVWPLNSDTCNFPSEEHW